MTKTKLFAAMAIVFTEAVTAVPAIVHQYDERGRVVGVNGLVNIEEPLTMEGSGCDHRVAEVTVDEVVYAGVNDVVAGFRAKKKGVQERYGLFKMDSEAIYRAVSNAERKDIQRLVHKGAQLLVIYQVCGSGGFIGVRDIFKKSAVNNP